MQVRYQSLVARKAGSRRNHLVGVRLLMPAWFVNTSQSDLDREGDSENGAKKVRENSI